MKIFEKSPDRVCDVLIAGAGLAGLAAAIAFARAGFDVVCCGVDERTAGGRTVALLDRSVSVSQIAGAMVVDRARRSAAAHAADHRRYGGSVPRPPGRVPMRRNRPRRLRLERRERPGRRRARSSCGANARASSGCEPRRPVTSFLAKKRLPGSPTAVWSPVRSSSARTAAIRRQGVRRDFRLARTATRKAR